MKNVFQALQLGGPSGGQGRQIFGQPKQRQLVAYALFSQPIAWVVAILIWLVALRVTPFYWWPTWAWLVVSAPIIVCLFWVQLRRNAHNRLLQLDLFQQQLDLAAIVDPALLSFVKAAFTHQRQIEEALFERKDDLMQLRLDKTAEQIYRWVEHIYQLAVRIQRLEENDRLLMELDSLPQELEALVAQQQAATTTSYQSDLARLIATKEKQLQSLQAFDTQIRQGHLKIEQSLSSMRHVYSQIHMIDARHMVGGETLRIQADIQSQVASLGDLVEGIRDVHG